MPELPEIETLRKSLMPMVGKTIARVRLSALAPVETTTPEKIRRCLGGAKLAALERRGKYLLLQGTGGAGLVIHLGMSGQLRYFPKGPPPAPKHTHLELKFSDGSLLRYVDARRFGTLSLWESASDLTNPFLQRLGPDFLDPKLKAQVFIDRCRRHPKVSLKSLCLNQGVATGLGNIYACEALYHAQLDPGRRVGRLSDDELARLLKSARHALRLGIRYGGVSMRDYLDGNGHRGIMKEFLQVYDREGQSSLDGRGQVERIIQNARSTFWVPGVQR